jgi:hypothetical protein
VEVAWWRPVVNDVPDDFFGNHVSEDVVPGTVQVIGNASDVGRVVTTTSAKG